MDVYIYKSGTTYLTFPPVHIAGGGSNVKFVNTTEDIVRVTLPPNARDDDEPEFRDIPSGKKQNIHTKDQGGGNTKSHHYTVAKKPTLLVKKKMLLKKLQGGSDPILILEN